MKIQIVNFFPYKNQRASLIRGTFHIRFDDLGFEMRGIYGQWNYKKDKIFFGFPWCGHSDIKTGKFKKLFPFLNIFDEKLRSNAFRALYTEGKRFMRESLKGP